MMAFNISKHGEKKSNCSFVQKPLIPQRTNMCYSHNGVECTSLCRQNTGQKCSRIINRPQTTVCTHKWTFSHSITITLYKTGLRRFRNIPSKFHIHHWIPIVFSFMAFHAINSEWSSPSKTSKFSSGSVRKITLVRVFIVNRLERKFQDLRRISGCVISFHYQPDVNLLWYKKFTKNKLSTARWERK